MQQDAAFMLLAQSTVARVLQLLRDTGREGDVTAIIGELEESEWTKPVATVLRELPVVGVEQLLLEAAGRVEAMDALAKCDVRLDALVRSKQDAGERFKSLDAAAAAISRALRRPSTVEEYLAVNSSAARALSATE